MVQTEVRIALGGDTPAEAGTGFRAGQAHTDVSVAHRCNRKKS